jgi:putative transcriptional regulator
MTIGCAKWVRGQLEHEVGRNAWLDCEADADIIFNTSDDEKWEAAVKKLGVDTLLFAPAWGHA